MPNTTQIVNVIQDNIDEFADSIEPIQRKLYNRVTSLLQGLTLDSDGFINRTQANMDIINDVKTELSSVVNYPAYQKNVAGIKSSLDDVTNLQTNYFGKISEDAKQPPVMDSIVDNSFDTVLASLTEAGINENVVSAATDIVSNGITEGSSFSDMNEALKTFMVGNDKVDGKLLSYSKQIVSDTMHTTSRNYNSIMTEKLGLKWYRYVGALVTDSRPWCIAMEEKEFIHESELGKCCAGNIDGKQVSKAGLMPDTTKDNVVSRCGGYNCGHHLVPIPSEGVPTNIRRKFEKDVALSDNEKADDRPRRK